MKPSQLRYLLACLMVAFVAGCAVLSSEPGPEAQNAAQRINSEIKEYRNGGAPPAIRGDASGYVRGGNLFAQVYEQVQMHYVREVDEEALVTAASQEMRKRYPDPSKAKDKDLVEAAVYGMLGSLDTYSTYLDEEHWRSLREQTRGRFGGLGIEVRKEGDYIEIVSPIDGTPAARAGLKTGDRILSANGRSLEGVLLRDAVLELRGDPGSKVVLGIKRGEKPPFDVTLERAIINIASVRWRTEGNIGYIRITSFSERVGEEVAEAVLALKRELGPRARGLILDLRNNPGGLLDQSIKVSDMFLDKGRIVSTRERFYEHHYDALNGDVSGGLPMVILINNGSASAAEIVAGALKDQRRATLVGTKSFGKGTVQTIIPLSGSDAVKLTTAVYLTPSGHSVDGGIVPDVVIPMDEKDEGDPQLRSAMSLLAGQTVARPRDVTVR
ncbi:MAG: PDZ domain-containing protein [Alphaproteobacteria bacterium]|nr:PDZ domain-containing protein [Alphaproteobacteria bacterium]